MFNYQHIASDASTASAAPAAAPARPAPAAARPAAGTLAPAPSARLDPRVSLAILLMLNAIAFAPTVVWTETAAALLCAAVMAWCRRPAPALRWLAAYAVLFAVAQALVAFPNAVTASFATMAVMFRRVFCVGMFASNMIATTRVGEMAAALQRLHVPRGGVVACSVALRFFPTIGAEFARVAEAMRVRGMALTPAFVLRHPALVVENLMVPVMSRLAIVAEELSNAATVRGIDSDAPRTSYYALRLRPADAVFAALFACVAAYVLMLKLGALA